MLVALLLALLAMACPGSAEADLRLLCAVGHSEQAVVCSVAFSSFVFCDADHRLRLSSHQQSSERFLVVTAFLRDPFCSYYCEKNLWNFEAAKSLDAISKLCH